MSRSAAPAIVALALVALIGCTGRTATGPARTVAACSWSFFGDARSVAHEATCSPAASAPTARRWSRISSSRRATGGCDAVFQPLEVDDHNNPGLAIFAEHLYAFSSPHSGYAYPRDRRSRMRYRVSGGLGRGGGWGAVAHGPARRRMRARLHLSEPGGRGRPALPLHARPVLDAVLHVDHRRPPLDPAAVARAQPVAQPPGRRRDAARAALREVRRRARRLGPDHALRRTPGVVQELAVLRPPQGRPLPRRGRPRRSARSRTCRCASSSSTASSRTRPRAAGRGRWTSPRTGAGCRWSCTRRWSARTTRSDTAAGTGGAGARSRSRSAGRTLFSYHNSGITLDHEDPSWVVLSRTIDGQNEIEARHTPDHGGSWCPVQLTRGSRVVQHPARDPARPERSAQARRALRRRARPGASASTTPTS